MIADLIGHEAIALRAASAAGLSLVLTALAIPRLAAWARRRDFGDREGKTHSDTLNELHAHKERTPIVGGIAILGAVLPAVLLLTDLTAPGVWILLATLFGLGALGFADDLAKTFGRKRTEGLTPKQKLLAQGLLGLGVGGAMAGLAYSASGAGGLAQQTSIGLPFLGGAISLGLVGYLLFTTFLVTGTSNAVNLTDGLDGLAGGCALVAFAFYAVLAAVAGQPEYAQFWGLSSVAGAGEVAVVLGAITGAVTGFLVFNRAPARVFMGDTGSLPLGGTLAVAALLTKQELLLALVGGVFVAEALSVILQVASFKLTGKRVFRCAPLHHHFEFGGWQETKVVGRFHAVSIVLALVALQGVGGGA
jgi:phospho-N-acetylmuramoyl-pentapeptide-transferase